MSVGEPTVSSFLDAFKLLERIGADLGDDNLFSDFLDLLPVFATQAAHSNDELQDQLLDAVHPYLTNSSESVFSAFGSLITLIRSDAAFAEGFARLVEGFWVQAHIRSILVDSGYGDDVFGGYIDCLQLSATHAAHQDILQRIWQWFEAKVNARTLRKLRIAFLQEEVAQNLGMDFDTMASAQMAVADDDLYKDVLNYLAMSHSQNIAWYQIFDMIKSMVQRQKPQVWDDLGTILSDWRLATAEEFLSKARQIIEDDDLFQEFSAQYLADSEESMKQLEESTDDGNLIEQLKRLQIATSPARPQGPRQTAL